MPRSKHYHKCFVPSCSNTSSNEPTKVFLRVSGIVKKRWCRQVKVEYDASRHMYCCEDHLNLEEDLLNYSEWKHHKAMPIIKNNVRLRNKRQSKDFCAKCFVPICPNTTTNSPAKEFLPVPATVKQIWCRQVYVTYDAARRMYCCEDHLKLEEDIENYNDWKMYKRRPIIKATAMLHKISSDSSEMVENKIENLDSAENETSVLRMLLLQKENIMPVGTPCTVTQPTDKFTATHPTQVHVAVQCSVRMVDRCTGTPRPRQMITTIESCPDTASSTTSVQSEGDSDVHPSLIGSTSGSECQIKKIKEYETREQTIKLIMRQPKAYLGLPYKYLWLLEYITKQSLTKIYENDLIISLLKLKLNDTLFRIRDQFEVPKSTSTKSLHCGIQVLANFFQNLFYMPSSKEIKKKLPLAFKIKYSNVQLLLDAFEIEIEKPSDPVCQAQTWSEYKHANTVKYLIGSTPNGFVSYVSKGYGGRISDKALVKESDLIERIPTNSVIMADRGFKEIESLLAPKGIRLLRPPSVYASMKPTKEEVLQTKVIASLRVHIERVIRRLREFQFLKPHSVVHHKNVGYLDQMVIIACGLINLQDDIIKQE